MCDKARRSCSLYEVPGKSLCLICYIYRQTANLTSCVLQRWYSQQATRGNAPEHPLGINEWGGLGPIELVGGEGGDEEDSDTESNVSPLFNMGG